MHKILIEARIRGVESSKGPYVYLEFTIIWDNKVGDIELFSTEWWQIVIMRVQQCKIFRAGRRHACADFPTIHSIHPSAHIHCMFTSELTFTVFSVHPWAHIYPLYSHSSYFHPFIHSHCIHPCVHTHSIHPWRIHTLSFTSAKCNT